MKKPENYHIQNLLSESEDILKELGPLDIIDEDNSPLTDKNISARSKELFRLLEDTEQEYKVNGSVEVMVFPDEMRAEANFYPPSEGMNPLTADMVYEKLAENHVVAGIDNEAITEAVFKCNTENIEISGVIAAHGTAPLNEVPDHIVMEQQLRIPDMNKTDPDAKIDYREQSPFIMVKAGQILAWRIPLKPGKNGETVTGEEIPFKIEHKELCTPGHNTEISGDCIVAVCDGRFETTKHEFYVNKVLQIDKDVDYSTGNIDFPGDVLINGQIHDGFRINSSGSIYIRGTMDASEIECKENLFVALGIIGRKKGTIKVGGGITAKFIENCYVEAGKTIRLEAGVMNSSIYTSEALILGKKGIIVGGTVYAQNGVMAAQIGTGMGPRTEIYCGIDYLISNKLQWIRDNNMKLAFKLNQITAELKKSRQENPPLEALRQKLKDSIHKLNEMAASLVDKLDKNEDAEIMATGKVYPGVYIEICHVSYIVNRQMSHVKFKLDKHKGTITESPL